MSKSKYKPSEQQILIARRRVARKAALTACYQWLMTSESFQNIYTYYQEDDEQKKLLAKADIEVFKELVIGVMKNRNELENAYIHYSDIELEYLEPLVRSALLLAAFELKNVLEVPYKVIINEWVNLSKKYGGAESFRYVNGMLTRMLEIYRPIEAKEDIDRFNRDGAKPSTHRKVKYEEKDEESHQLKKVIQRGKKLSMENFKPLINNK